MRDWLWLLSQLEFDSKLVFDDGTTINGPVLSMVHQKAEYNNATIKQHAMPVTELV